MAQEKLTHLILDSLIDPEVIVRGRRIQKRPGADREWALPGLVSSELQENNKM